MAPAASYDLLLGYAGIVSFAHVMFFGVGSYGVALALYGFGPGWGVLAEGFAVGAGVALVLAVAIRLFSLRVQTIFFRLASPPSRPQSQEVSTPFGYNMSGRIRPSIFPFRSTCPSSWFSAGWERFTA